jgi:hypothetical protein
MPKATDFLSLLLEEHSSGDGSKRECPLGAGKPQPRCLAAGHHQGRHAPIRQGLLAALTSSFGRCGVATVGRRPLHGNGLKAARARISAWLAVLGMRVREGLQVDFCGLIEQSLRPGGVQIRPKLKHVGMPKIAKAITDFVETSVLGVLLSRIDFNCPRKESSPQ